MRLAVLLGFAIAACILSAPKPAQAAACTASIEDLDFGEVDTLSGAFADTAAAVRVDCSDVSPGTSVVTACLSLGPGTGGGTSGVRQMTSGASRLGFQLYRNAGRSLVWGGAGIGSALRLSLPVSGESADAGATLYGRVSGGQAGTVAGSYASGFSGADGTYTYAEGPDLDCDSGAGASGQAAFAVAAKVPANCLVEASDIAFGAHAGIDRPIDAAGDIAVTCTPGTAYAVTLGGGLHGDGRPDARIMRSGEDTAVYGLYRDAARSEPWGSSLETRLPGTGEGTRQAVTVYGRVPPQNARPGNYGDTVAVTITYDDPSAP